MVKLWDARGLSGYFCDSFACCPDLPVQKLHSYLADFPHLGEAEAVSCEGLVTECEVHDMLKKIGLNKLPGLDGLPYEVYLMMSYMFVPILTDMSSHWFAQGAIPGCIIKGVIALLKKGGRHIWEDLDDFRPIIRQNTELDFCSLSLVIWLDLNRTMLWREDWSKTTCI